MFGCFVKIAAGNTVLNNAITTIYIYIITRQHCGSRLLGPSNNDRGQALDACGRDVAQRRYSAALDVSKRPTSADYVAAIFIVP